jgi:glutamate dehydrogenase
MGITARGAWACVQRHFRELDVDVQTMPVRVIGVGDMSGDVFGNGMLLSPQIRLLAAFDHRDIFIDPNPDPAQTLAERQRLFALARSSWQDFDRTKISAGGGVFARSAKSIPLSPQIRAVLGIEAASLTPNDLITAILKIDTDLLWFGGIGTYVRASSESDEQVGDKANDAVRISAPDLKCKVIGEGANLGITQRGRIEAATRGIRLNADFIDNSAGVNTSDQEVNIKIALTPLTATGKLISGDRLTLLTRMTDDVAAACLANNYQQSLAISLAQRASARDIGYLARLARVLEDRRLLDRKLEALPTGAEFAQRQNAGNGLARPEIAVLLSWAKIALNADLLASKAPDDAALHPMLSEYFPAELRAVAQSGIDAHPLRREIIATRITNSMINRGGPAMAVRLMDETGRSAEDIAYAFLAARASFGLPELWQRIDELDLKIPGSVQLDLYAETQTFLLAATAGLLRRPPGSTLMATIAACRPAVEDLASMAVDVCTPAQKTRARDWLRQLEQAGVPASVADRVTILPVLIHAPTIVDLIAGSGRSSADAARAVLGASDYFRIDELDTKARQLKISDYYDRLALNSALGALKAASRILAQRVLKDGDVSDVGGWAVTRAPQLRAAKAVLDDIVSSGDLTVSRLTVAAAQVRDHTE